MNEMKLPHGSYPNSVDEAAQGFAALGSPARLTLLRILVRTGEDGLNIGQLQQSSGIPASTLAHHLRSLVSCGLVIQEKNGREIITRPNYSHVGSLSHFLICECVAESHQTESVPSDNHLEKNLVP